MFMVGRLAATISFGAGLAARGAKYFSSPRLFLSFMQTIFYLTLYRTCSKQLHRIMLVASPWLLGAVTTCSYSPAFAGTT